MRRFWSNRLETEALSRGVMLPFRASNATCVILTLVNLPVFAGHFQTNASCGASGVGAECTFLLTRDAGTHRSVPPTLRPVDESQAGRPTSHTYNSRGVSAPRRRYYSCLVVTVSSQGSGPLSRPRLAV